MSGSRARLLLTLTCAAGLVPAAQAQARTDSAVAGAVRYLRAAQNPDGGLGPEPGLRSTTLYGAWSAIGLAAAGVPCSSARHDGGRSLASYTAAYAPSARMTGDVERAMLALGACGVPVPHALRTRLAAARRPDGSYGGQVNYTAFAVLALRATGTRASDPAIHAAGRWLSTQAADDGAFNYGGRGASGDVDDTGAVLEALVAAGRPRSSRVAQRAVRFILTHQGDDGGFGGSRSNAQSTAFGVQGLLAMGTDVDKVLRSGNSPLHYLRSLQTTAARSTIRAPRTRRPSGSPPRPSPRWPGAPCRSRRKRSETHPWGGFRNAGGRVVREWEPCSPCCSPPRPGSRVCSGASPRCAGATGCTSCSASRAAR